MGHFLQLRLLHDLISLACTVRGELHLPQINGSRPRGGEVGQGGKETLPFAAACSSQTWAQVEAGCEREASLRPSLPRRALRCGAPGAPAAHGTPRLPGTPRLSGAPRLPGTPRLPGAAAPPFGSARPGPSAGHILLVSRAAALPWHWLRLEGTASLLRGS